MKFACWLLAVVVSCVPLAGCGAYSNSCSITAVVTPATATADHGLAPPGNQAQFSLKSSVQGNCPLVADTVGIWSTSDPVNATISNQGLATCQNGPASVMATINNSSRVRGRAFTSATLTCK